ncbi:MAG: DUF2007 domain-containing protein [Paludibacteraceae bacterium]|jgi:hypothetical protein|nr:DUF2007 domain-containing protein [Paludibacteraceae bacterium]MBQ6562050.1 DUF2007 domain-containing protein [Paludibacteraceae bacterium]MBQ8018967.1 DUF2007 domain-containing protein [Paludibacteraceae bacterium]MEE0084540.1 DUF2007 domain-containing protein [Paludibacteraceae bacterium]
MESVNNEKVVVFRTYNTLFEANVVKELLASNDIPSMIKNEHTTVLLPMFSPMSGVALMVLEKDLAKAQEIVDGTNNSDNGLIEK